MGWLWKAESPKGGGVGIVGSWEIAKFFGNVWWLVGKSGVILVGWWSFGCLVAFIRGEVLLEVKAGKILPCR